MTNKFVGTHQAALMLGVSQGTVQKMVEKGVLEAWKTKGGHRRIPVLAINRLIAERSTETQANKRALHEIDVLIAEDEPSLQLLYQTALEDWNLPIAARIVDNGFDGLLQVGQRRPDVLISDLMMPSMDGFEMIRHLRQRPDMNNMAIIVVSALDKSIISAHGLPDDVIVFDKPVPFDKLRTFLCERIKAQREAQFKPRKDSKS